MIAKFTLLSLFECNLLDCPHIHSREASKQIKFNQKDCGQAAESSQYACGQRIFSRVSENKAPCK